MHLKEPSVCLTSHSESANFHLNFTLLTKSYVLVNIIKSLLFNLLFANRDEKDIEFSGITVLINDCCRW